MAEGVTCCVGTGLQTSRKAIAEVWGREAQTRRVEVVLVAFGIDRWGCENQESRMTWSATILRGKFK